MPMSESDAAVQADSLIRHLIQHQPQLTQPLPPTETGGARLAEFIASLRKGLIEMFKTQP